MEWRKPSAAYSYLVSEPEGFVINRSGGERVVYMAIRSGKPWAESKWRPRVTPGIPDAWDGSTILHVERDLDPTNKQQLADALERCKAACEEEVSK